MSEELEVLSRQVTRESYFNSLITAEDSSLSSKIEKMIRKVISAYRSFCLIDTWYSKISESNVMSFIVSQKSQNDRRKTFDSPTSLELSTEYALQINNFMKIYQKYLNVILDCSVLYFKDVNKLKKYIPLSSSKSFFASSTLPSLFGFGWCVEQQIAYTDAVIYLVKKQIELSQSVQFVSFKNSFIKDVLRQYLRINGAQQYLQNALKNELMVLYNEDKYFDSLQIDTIDYYKVLITYVKNMTISICQSIVSLPPILKYFFKKLYTIANEILPDESFDLIEYIFFDILVQPALLNPKLYALIPETTITHLSQHISNLLRVFRWSINNANIPENIIHFNFLNLTEFQELNVKEILIKLVSNDYVIPGISLKHLKDYFNISNHFILTSVNDIQLISDIVLHSIDNIEGDFEELKRTLTFTEKYKENELIDFWYQVFSVPKYDKEDIKIQELPIEAINEKTSEDNNKAMNSLSMNFISYLSEASVDKRSTLDEVLAYNKKKSKGLNNLELLIKTEVLKNKIKNEDEFLLRKEMKQLIQAKIARDQSQLQCSYYKKVIIDLIENGYNVICLISKQLKPIVHQYVLRLFLLKNKQVLVTLHKKENLLIQNTTEWVNFFLNVVNDVKSFLESMEIDSEFSIGLIRQLHSFLVGEISFDKYKSLHQEFNKKQEFLSENYQNGIQNMQKQNNSLVLKNILNSSDSINLIVQEINAKLDINVPMNFVEKCSKIMKLINSIYNFENEYSKSNEIDIRFIITFCIIQSHPPDLFTQFNYITHFLLSIDQNTQILHEDERYTLTNFFSAFGNTLKYCSFNI